MYTHLTLNRLEYDCFDIFFCEVQLSLSFLDKYSSFKVKHHSNTPWNNLSADKKWLYDVIDLFFFSFFLLYILVNFLDILIDCSVVPIWIERALNKGQYQVLQHIVLLSKINFRPKYWSYHWNKTNIRTFWILT